MNDEKECARYLDFAGQLSSDEAIEERLKGLEIPINDRAMHEEQEGEAYDNKAGLQDTR